MSIIEQIRAKLSGGNYSVIFPEGEDERILLAATSLATGSLSIKVTVLGSPERIQAIDARNNIPQSAFDVLDPMQNADEDTLAHRLLQARPDMKAATARRLVRKPLYCAGMLLNSGRGDAMVAGVTCPTARVIEAALTTIGLEPDVSSPSSAFMIAVPTGSTERNILFADCALNIEPTASTLADIAVASARTMLGLTGEEPRVAFLSFSTHGSTKHISLERVRDALRLAKLRAPQFNFDGEMQADAALSPRVARLKTKGESAVEGQANVLIFPDLNSGNIGYKLVQYPSNASARGPILQGFARPVSDMSRGASVQDIIDTTLLTLGRAAASLK